MTKAHNIPDSGGKTESIIESHIYNNSRVDKVMLQEIEELVE